MPPAVVSIWQVLPFLSQPADNHLNLWMPQFFFKNVIQALAEVPLIDFSYELPNWENDKQSSTRNEEEETSLIKMSRYLLNEKSKLIPKIRIA